MMSTSQCVSAYVCRPLIQRFSNLSYEPVQPGKLRMQNSFLALSR